MALYLSKGRANTDTSHAPDPETGNSALAVLPGGGASAVAHLIGVPLVVTVGWTIAGLAMWPMIIVIAVLAIVMLAVYERVAGNRPRTARTRGLSLAAALMAAVVTVAAFDIGMVSWMLLLHFNNAMPPVTASTFWFLMQVGIVVGLMTGYPAVRWLLRRDQTAVPV